MDRRLAKIRSAIDRAAQEYYRIGGRTVMTDRDYDLLIKELRKLDPNDPRLTRVGQPYESNSMRTKRKHLMPMGSLDNTDNSIFGLEPWLSKATELAGVSEVAVHLSLKMDGCSVELNYTDGQLESAISRGNGTVGDCLTANAVLWQNVPTTLAEPVTCSVRGECILHLKDFNDLREADADLSNARNTGNGICGRTDGTQNQLIRFYAFNAVGLDATTLSEKYKKLESLGFTTAPWRSLSGELSDVVADCKTWFDELAVSERDKLPFEIDGLVIMLDDVATQKRLTRDSKDEMRPRYGRAIKFETRKDTTVITGMVITVGHTGHLCPTADLEPVEIGGVTVDSAQLGNWDEIARLGINIGDVVAVQRSGDCAPKIIALVEKHSKDTYPEPTTCPCCGSPATRVNPYRSPASFKGGALTYCSKPQTCPAAAVRRIDHYIGDSKHGVGILGVGTGVLQALTAGPKPLVLQPSDLYRLTIEQLKDLVIGRSASGASIRMGAARAAALVEQINKARTIPLHKFLGSLGVDLLGRRKVEILAKTCHLYSIEDWLDADKLAKIPGDVTRQSIIEGIEANREIIADLLIFVTVTGLGVPAYHVGVDQSSGEDFSVKTTYQASEDGGVVVTNHLVTAQEAKEVAMDMGIAGKAFVFTGTRDGVEDVERLGGIVKSSMSAKVQYLVQKDPMSRSGKTQKAEELGIKIISVQRLKEAIDGINPL